MIMSEHPTSILRVWLERENCIGIFYSIIEKLAVTGSEEGVW
jgi:hypothetical protein